MTSLSLRARFISIAALTVLILLAAGYALVVLEARTDAGRRRRAIQSGEAMVTDLLKRPGAHRDPVGALTAAFAQLDPEATDLDLV